MSCIFVTMNLSVVIPKWSKCYLTSDCFWSGYTFYKKVDVHWRPLSAPGNWQQADVAMTQSKSSLSPVVSSGERSSPQTGDKGESEHTKDQGKPGIKTQENSS